ncbi:MAG: hypothetical protein HLUCCO16_10070 [Phormidium sp. OSCR]|nr:MAG: hypothetical protein HLUCCO16_10070 [Phormidium sp. OSCR]
MKTEYRYPLSITMMATSTHSVSHPQSSVLILTGMRQSGLSLASALLDMAGCQIKGSATYSDTLHHEPSFIDFHESVLTAQTISSPLDHSEPLTLSPEQIDQAQKLLSRHSEASSWGWVDPRTTLFLDFWNHQISNVKFILVYRSPWDVIDNMYQKFGDPLQRSPELAMDLWLTYNRRVLGFYKANSQNCFLANIKHIQSQPEIWIKSVNEKFNMKLNLPNNIHKELDFRLNNDGGNSHKQLIKDYFLEALELYQSLNEQAWSPLVTDPLSKEYEAFDSTRTFIFHDWFKLRQQEQRLQESQSQLKDIEFELEFRMIQVHQIQEELVESQIRLKEQEISIKNYKLKEIAGAKIESNYDNLVWNAWLAYCDNDFHEITQYLQESMKHKQISKTAIIVDWLNLFSHFSKLTEYPFDSQTLTKSQEWQQLVRWIVNF